MDNLNYKDRLLNLISEKRKSVFNYASIMELNRLYWLVCNDQYNPKDYAEIEERIKLITF